MITQSKLKELLNYNPDTGEFTWLKTNSITVKIGDIAGTIDTNKYRRIGINGKRYMAHRLAWLYMTGNFPENYIDHINHNPDDNAISNLREATPSQNNSNAKVKKNNASGYKGVEIDKKNKNYRANIWHNNKNIYLGKFDTAELAHKAYCIKAKELKGQFACFG